jgi:hypothetical protein
MELLEPGAQRGKEHVDGLGGTVMQDPRILFRKYPGGILRELSGYNSVWQYTYHSLVNQKVPRLPRCQKASTLDRLGNNASYATRLSGEWNEGANDGVHSLAGYGLLRREYAGIVSISNTHTNEEIWETHEREHGWVADADQAPATVLVAEYVGEG